MTLPAHIARAQTDAFRITFGVDPGISGAIVVLADGEPVEFVDMPIYDRAGGGNEVDPFALAAQLRGIMQKHRGAFFSACLELIATRPTNARGLDQRAGEGYGIVKGVFGSLGIRWCEVRPQVWKKHYGLIGTEKDVARQYCVERFTSVSNCLMRKKDNGRADALLIARWAWETENFGPITGTRAAPDLFKGAA